MNDNMIVKVKRMLADSLDDNCETAVWYCWAQYIGAELEDMTEAQPLVAKQTMKESWTHMSKTYDQSVEILLDSVRTENDDVDIEIGLKEWKNFTSIIKGAADYEEVFYRERVIFNNYGLGKTSCSAQQVDRTAGVGLRSDSGFKTSGVG
jgi:hypothetical protein